MWEPPQHSEFQKDLNKKFHIKDTRRLGAAQQILSPGKSGSQEFNIPTVEYIYKILCRTCFISWNDTGSNVVTGVEKC